MSSQLEMLEAQALKLSPEERAQLIPAADAIARARAAIK